jgi:UDP-N-acetylglucosamine--N-acetylmuramyl-(pentapeptide) pyrophosphoryl-undecaprenol N-acetylglucosamine transferase
MNRVAFVGGGSGGHIFPLIAVWRELQTSCPEAEALFVCTERPEDGEYLKKETLEYRALTLPRRSIMLPFTLATSYRQAQSLLREFQPDAIFSKGGAISVPVCLAAKRMGIPIVLHESDAVMGRANRMISRWADSVCIGLESSTLDIRHSKIRLTGNPVRPEMTHGSKAEAIKLTGFTDQKPVLLVYGGSQGSQALNEWTVSHLDEVLDFANVIHLTGNGKKGADPRKGYFIREFAFGELPHLYALADLAVARAGSGTISELAANGIPAVLVPLRGLAQDHQELNARAAEKSGGCIVVEQTEIDRKLTELIRVTLADHKNYDEMRRSMRGLHRPDAASAISKLVCEAAEKHLPDRHKIR